MDRLLYLMEERNGYMKKFRRMNTEQIEKLAVSEFSGLDFFQENRENLLQILERMEAKINDVVSRLEEEKAVGDQSFRHRVSKLCDEKEILLSEILDQDLQIIEIVEKEKSSVIQELKETRKKKQAFRKYHSERKARPKHLDSDY